jgi:hypothetical protein
VLGVLIPVELLLVTAMGRADGGERPRVGSVIVVQSCDCADNLRGGFGDGYRFGSGYGWGVGHGFGTGYGFGAGFGFNGGMAGGYSAGYRHRSQHYSPYHSIR